MNKIKLNKIENFQLTNNEKQELRGGESDKPVYCCCGCLYEGQPGGSTTNANLNANYVTGKKTPGCPPLFS